MSAIDHWHMSNVDERDDIIRRWLAEGHDNLLAHAQREMCPDAQEYDAATHGYTTLRGMFQARMWRRSAAEVLRMFWVCRVCGDAVSEVARMAPDPRVDEHRIDHCERWLVERRYVVPGRYEHRDVLADALSLAFSTLARTVR